MGFGCPVEAKMNWLELEETDDEEADGVALYMSWNQSHCAEEH